MSEDSLYNEAAKAWTTAHARTRVVDRVFPDHTLPALLLVAPVGVAECNDVSLPFTPIAVSVAIAASLDVMVTGREVTLS